MLTMRELPRFLLVGLVSGWIAAIATRGSKRVRGCITYTVVGVTGALVGGYSADAVGNSEVASVVGATLGAILLLVLVRALRTR